MNNTAEEITAIFEREDPEARVTRGDQVPPSYASITPEWLTDVLCQGVPSAKVVSHHFDARDDGSTNRRRIFLAYNRSGTDAGLPASVFCKAAETLENRLVSGATGAGRAEVNFYSKPRPQLQIETPVSLYAKYDDSNHASLVMLRDLGDSVEFCTEKTTVDFERAKSQMSLLAKLHATFYQSGKLGGSALPFHTWDKWWVSMIALSPLFSEYCDRGFVDSEEIMPRRLFQRRREIWPATMASAARHADLPHSLIHCDVHLKNWYVTGNGDMGVGDWQCVAIGHWSRDVIYALTTALTIENRRKWEQELLAHYLEELAALGVAKVSLAEAWKNLRQQIFTVLAFWTITLRPAPGMPDMQPRETSIEFLKRIYAAMDDHDALDSFR